MHTYGVRPPSPRPRELHEDDLGDTVCFWLTRIGLGSGKQRLARVGDAAYFA